MHDKSTLVQKSKTTTEKIEKKKLRQKDRKQKKK